jgi:polar amino acid transport system permease protein
VGSFDWNVVASTFPALLKGFEASAILTILVIGISMVAAVPVALARMANFDLLRWVAQGYIEVFRCTPLLIQLFWIFYALPILIGVQLPGFTAALIAISCNLTAQVAEVYRSGFQSIPVEQIEAATVLQVPRFNQVVSIIVPQTLRQQLPALLSIAINGLKDTALVSTIGVLDLMFAANTASAQTYRAMEILTTAAVMYFAVAFPISLIVSALERRARRKGMAAIPRRRLVRIAAAS